MSDHEHRIRERAYALWEKHGMPSGKAHDHWEQASREIAEENEGSSTSAPPADGNTPAGRTRPTGTKQAKSKNAAEAPAASAAPASGTARKKAKAAGPSGNEAAPPKKPRHGKA